MLQFSTPLGMLALATVAAPVLIHLIRRPLQTVRLGSLRFLTAERRQVRSLRWRHLLLLALRCGLLVALALLVAGLTWKPSAPTPARWIFLLPGAALSEANQIEWRKLRADGYEPHQLTTGFPPGSSQPTAAATLEPVDVWSLLREADAYLPAGSEAVVFGPPLARYFRGPRPTLTRLKATWESTPVTGENEKSPSQPLPPVRAAVIAGNNRVDDARYVAAMLRANLADLNSGQPDWIFQLGDAPLSPALRERITSGATLVTDASDSAGVVAGSRTFVSGEAEIHLRQRVILPAGWGLLADDRGEDIATRGSDGLGAHWRFGFRFHPDWTDWTLSSAFAVWWQSQFHPPQFEAGAITAEQAAPLYAPSATSAAPYLAGFGDFDARQLCWLVAVILFLAERWLSFSLHRRTAAA